MSNISGYERETIINYNNEEKVAQVYTCNESLQRKLDKLCEEYPECTCINFDEYSKTYIVPKKWVKIRPPRKMSEENKQKASERMKQYQLQQKQKSN